jgi:hypothetical protein
MNRYAIAGARLDMAAGMQVLVVMQTRTGARQAFEQVYADLVEGEMSSIIRSNGLEEIRSASGGSIRFAGQRDVRLRDARADVVVADQAVREDHADDLRRIVLRSHIDEAVLPA